MEKAIIWVWLLGIIAGITALIFAKKTLKSRRKEGHV